MRKLFLTVLMTSLPALAQAQDSKWSIEVGGGLDSAAGGSEYLDTGYRLELGGAYTWTSHRDIVFTGSYASNEGKSASVDVRELIEDIEVPGFPNDEPDLLVETAISAGFSNYQRMAFELGLRQAFDVDWSIRSKKVRPYVQGVFGATKVDDIKVERINIDPLRVSYTPGQAGFYDRVNASIAAQLQNIPEAFRQPFIDGVVEQLTEGAITSGEDIGFTADDPTITEDKLSTALDTVLRSELAGTFGDNWETRDYKVFEGGWVPSAALLVGFDVPVTENTLVGLETGIRYTNEIDASSFITEQGDLLNELDETSTITIPLTVKAKYKF